MSKAYDQGYSDGYAASRLEIIACQQRVTTLEAELSSIPDIRVQEAALVGENARSELTARLLAQVGSTDGLCGEAQEEK